MLRQLSKVQRLCLVLIGLAFTMFFSQIIAMIEYDKLGIPREWAKFWPAYIVEVVTVVVALIFLATPARSPVEPMIKALSKVTMVGDALLGQKGWVQSDSLVWVTGNEVGIISTLDNMTVVPLDDTCMQIEIVYDQAHGNCAKVISTGLLYKFY